VVLVDIVGEQLANRPSSTGVRSRRFMVILLNAHLPREVKGVWVGWHIRIATDRATLGRNRRDSMRGCT
jgi:hypothetical protein